MNNTQTFQQQQQLLQEKIKREGHEVDSQHGKTLTLYGEKIVDIKAEPGEEIELEFPYWEQEEDELYHELFISKQTPPPEKRLETQTEQTKFAYRYVDRSRYYDHGLGFLYATCKLLGEFKISSISDVENKLQEISKYIHIFSFLRIINSYGLKTLLEFSKDLDALKKQLEVTRIDSIDMVAEVLKRSPTSRQAITPSYMYSNIDYSAYFAAVPPYQSYQAFVVEDKDDKYLISTHLHRSIDANGGIQLDYTNDVRWGRYIANKLGVRLGHVIITTNNAHIYQPAVGSNNNLTSKTTLKSWLKALAKGYDNEEIPKFLEKHKTEIEDVLKNQR